MGKWFLARHGDTIWSGQGRAMGQVDVPLSAQGMQQAQALGRRLAPVPLRAAYASDLSRAAETARIALDGRQVALHQCSALREASFGQWDGLTYAEIERLDPKGYSAYLSTTSASAPPGGESANDLLARVRPLVEDLCARSHSEDILIVGHGGSLRALIVLVLGLPPEYFWSFALDVASLSRLEVYPNRVVLSLLNDTSHLQAPAR